MGTAFGPSGLIIFSRYYKIPSQAALIEVY